MFQSLFLFFLFFLFIFFKRCPLVHFLDLAILFLPLFVFSPFPFEHGIHFHVKFHPYVLVVYSYCLVLKLFKKNFFGNSFIYCMYIGDYFKYAIIIMACHWQRFPQPSPANRPDRPSLSVGLPCYILFQYKAVVDKL